MKKEKGTNMAENKKDGKNALIATTATATTATKTVDQLLSKYGFTSGKPQVKMYKNLTVATSAYVKALVASGFIPTEKDDKLTFVKGTFSVVFKGTSWEMFKADKLIENSHYGNGSIDLARWHVKHS